jgi:phosphoribosylanthranilate isomerase
MTRVKICGIKTIQEAMLVQQSGAWALGEVFAPSSRRISPEEGARINRMVRGSVKRVGVFVDETVDNVLRIARMCALDFIQLHGSEPPEYLEELDQPVIKAFSVSGPVNAAEIKKWKAWAYLLDTAAGEKSGGTGRSFDWNWLRELNGLDNLILAGGLNHENVGQAIRQVRPMAVDVSSGVEYPGGGKDPRLIAEFLQAVTEVEIKR